VARQAVKVAALLVLILITSIETLLSPYLGV
jgi:hypothetical protein